MGDRVRRPRDAGREAQEPEPDGAELLQRVARGDEAAFVELYDLLIGPLFGVIRRVVRDPAQSEEVAQEVMVELWRSAARYSPERGSAMTWAMTVAHRRAVDRVRSAQAAADREENVGRRQLSRPFDEVSEQVATRLEQEQVRRCLGTLTELQRESVVLAYYGGRSYREVGELLDTPLGTIKTRLRDGLIRLRDCLGVAS
ncbi:ECF RNA polymerase sigma factor SigK [Actinophytocola xanthii]|uniref:RNA polymerase subunit sigma n=1 Tax=Actinophytocola xanthii TaxID=1912961 RepID=A0A1Q8CWK5_9PSEU|nr:ECF RNA polymerase sigma factor SigK [Actinophytocola xanthii]OLF18730.1 RNA polymerase subunit sigma [Actinophytocola xanthii]